MWQFFFFQVCSKKGTADAFCEQSVPVDVCTFTEYLTTMENLLEKWLILPFSLYLAIMCFMSS